MSFKLPTAIYRLMAKTEWAMASLYIFCPPKMRFVW